MTRKRITLGFIPNDAERKASFKKREKGLIKKVDELSTLCGVDTCAIIYSPYKDDPTVWPSREGAETVLARFHELPEITRARKMLDQESFMRQRIQKVEEQLQRLRKEGNRLEIETFMYKCINGNANYREFNIGDVDEMRCVVNQTLNEISSKKEEIRVKNDNIDNFIRNGDHWDDELPLP